MHRSLLLSAFVITAFASSPTLMAKPIKNVSLDLKIKRSGLDFQGDCIVRIFEAGSDREVLVHRSKAKMELKAGAYEALVECKSTEGLYKQTFALNLDRSKTKTIRLRPGFILARVLRDKQEVPATLEVYDSYGRRVQRGRDLTPLPVPPGLVGVVAEVDKKALSKDSALRANKRALLGSARVKVIAGKKKTLRIDTSDGKLVVRSTRNGKKASGTVSLRLPGTRKEVARGLTDKAFVVPPGDYVAVTKLDDAYDFHEQSTRVKVRPRKTARAKTAHTTGSVSVKVTRDGKVLSDEQTIKLYKGAAPESFNSMGQSDRAILEPGQYRVSSVKGAVRAEKSVRVRARKNSHVSLDLTAASVQVQTFFATKKQKMRVEFKALGGQKRGKVVAKKDTDRKGQIGVELPPGEYEARAFFESPLKSFKPEFSVSKKIVVTKGKTVNVRLEIELGRALVQVFERGVAVPAQVAFYREEARDPLLSALAGEEVLLPEGRYVLQISRNNYTRNFSGVGIVNGGMAERQIDWLDEKGHVPKAKVKKKKRLD